MAYPFKAKSVISTGTFQRSLDGKLRVLLPKRIREGLLASRSEGFAQEAGEGDGPSGSAATGIELFLTPGTDSCLELHTSESLTELAQQAKENRPGTQNLRSFLRLFYARAQACEIDAQGRIRLPKELAEFACLEKEIVFVGVGFHWEVWDASQWQDYLAQNHQQYDAIVEAALDQVPASGIDHSHGNRPPQPGRPK